AVPLLPPTRSRDLSAAIEHTGVAVDEHTLPTLWGGEHLDLGHVVWTLLPQNGMGPRPPE
ncbi:MAG: hypothetical protein QOK14_914, partial [Frankiaceae bacterium]|nr:hypothetical protein [Frankiaceae bacterium]